MADREDQKNKSAAAAIPAKGAPVAKPSASQVVAAGKGPAPVSPASAKTEVAVSKPTETPAASTSVAALSKAEVKAPAPVAPPVAKPVIEKAAAPKAPDAKPAAAVKPPFAQPVAAKGKPGPKPKFKADEAAPAQAKSVDKVVPAPVASTPPASKVATEVKSQVAALTSPKAAEEKTAETVSNTKPVFAGLFSNFMLEETTMDMSNNFAGLQTAMTDAQLKAKAAFEKSTSVLGEVTEFTKGNVEAYVESGKIFAEGVQSIGSELVSEGRTAFEAMTGDIKELAAAKSPTDFFKIQSDMVRKNFDSAVAHSSKNSEAFLKLFSDSFAPISGRMSVAMEKARSVSI